MPLSPGTRLADIRAFGVVRPGPECQASPPRSLGVVPAHNVSFFLRSDFTRVLATAPTGNAGGPSVTVVSNWLAAPGKR
jgi:hypothetical protein